MTRSSKTFFPFIFYDQYFVRISDLSHALYMPSYLILLDLAILIAFGEEQTL
jgi:hypothetical protein